jgi:hypothetical protein
MLWSDMSAAQKVEAVQGAIDLHPTFSATELGLLLGCGRNSILSLLHRRTDIFTPRPAARKHRPKPTPEMRRGMGFAPHATPKPSTDESKELRKYDYAFQPLPGSMPKRLEDLNAHDCKWPVGEQPTTHCALHAPDGRYCETHTKMSGVRLPPMV